MFRRRVMAAGAGGMLSSLAGAHRWLSLSGEARDMLTKHLAALKEECKGQSLDLADMGDASKSATRSFQECVQKSGVEDPQFKGKIATLSASVKAYNTRLTNLQNEARSIQTEVDALLKILWGTESPRGASFSNPPPSSAGAEAAPVKKAMSNSDGFDVEPPTVARVLDAEPAPGSKVERVEGERVTGETKASSNPSTATEAEGEIEVETIEIEVEPPAAGEETAVNDTEDPVDTMKITDITKELYERGVNFADCLDARTLRQRYRDVLSGKVSAGYSGQKQGASSSAYTKPLSTDDASGGSSGSSAQQPRMPPRAQGYQHQYQPPPPNTNASGLAYDPYPNAERKMVDPMKRVWEVKQEIATEKGVDPASVDLWSGKTKLEDGKRLYDYPSIQNYPIEVRQKGDIPR